MTLRAAFQSIIHTGAGGHVWVSRFLVSESSSVLDFWGWLSGCDCVVAKVATMEDVARISTL